jgi:phosphotriesterase-related protein
LNKASKAAHWDLRVSDSISRFSGQIISSREGEGSKMSTVMTVRGPIAIEDMGITMNHVHVLINLMCWFQEPLEASRMFLSNLPVTMDILGDIRRDIFINKDNMILGDIDLAIQEVMEFKKLGGSTLVEVTPQGIGRDPVGLRKISEITGLNIICSTGWYVAFSHPPLIKQASIDDLYNIMLQELTEGIDRTGIKAGFIGEIAMSGTPDRPFEDDEEKVLRAAARASAKTGVPVTVHPNFFGKHVDTYIDVLLSEGARKEKIFISHMEMYPEDLDYQKAILDRGVSISYDQFGFECYMDSMAPGAGLPADRERVNNLVSLIQAGYEKQLLISNECCFKVLYKRYGGYGYGHILEHIVPELIYKGIPEEKVRTILVDNPKRLFE